MASRSCDNRPNTTLGGKVFHSLVIPLQPAAALSTEAQVEVTICFQLDQMRHYCLSNLNEVQNSIIFTPQTLRFDLNIFKDQDQVSLLLGSMLTRFHFPSGSNFFHHLIDKIRHRGLEIIADYSITSNTGPVVLLLNVKLVGKEVVQHVDYENEWDLMLGRALEESQLAMVAGNYGMVPAEESSVKKMLKKVRAEVNGESCMICLEQLEGALDAWAQMPCSHAFHSSCIETWLKQSHYCPVCRFEMPT